MPPIYLYDQKHGLVPYGPVFRAPGTCGFVDEGHIYTPYYKVFFGYSWDGTTMAFKTTTVWQRDGNMPLKADDGITSTEKIPRCIDVNFLKGCVLNAVSLGGPGLVKLLQKNVWQNWPVPFFISFKTVGETIQERLSEAESFVEILKPELDKFRSPVALQQNWGCPNVKIDKKLLTSRELEKHERKKLSMEISDTHTVLRELGIAIVDNFGPTADPEIVAITSEKSDALWLANTLPWDDIPPSIRLRLFGTLESPLLNRNLPIKTPGGLSSPVCLDYTIRQVRAIRALGVKKPIIAGGGIQSIKAVKEICDEDVNGIAMGVIGIVRPWRMKSVISYANELLGGK